MTKTFSVKLKFVSLPELLLIVVIPLLTYGMGWFEESGPYKKMIGIHGVPQAINEKLLGLEFNGKGNIHFLFPKDAEFIPLWNIIKSNSTLNFPNETPRFIGVVGASGMPKVFWPLEENLNSYIELVPESSPVMVGFCNFTESFDTTKCRGFGNDQNAFTVGTINDLKNWVQIRESTSRREIDLLITLISITLGLISHSRSQKGNKWSGTN